MPLPHSGGWQRIIRGSERSGVDRAVGKEMCQLSAIDPRLDAFIAAMPKAELHVHLEGTVKPATLIALADEYGIDLPITSLDDIEQFYTFRDFDHFIEIYITVCTCLCTPEAFTRITVDLGEEAHRQNIRYLEIHTNPEPHVRKRGISFPDLLHGLNAGRDEVRRRWGIELRWIFDGVRDAESGPRSVTQTVEWMKSLGPGDGVIGLGLGGTEHTYPPGQFHRDFAAAREAGYHIVAHAGETGGPESMWEAIRRLEIERIGHGIAAIQDPELVAYLRETGLPLEVCPSSNVRTGVVPTPQSHPVRALDEAGVCVTINSDDPPMFGTTLTDEYRFLARHFGYDASGIERLSLNAARASFLPVVEKERMLANFRGENARLRRELRI